MNRQDLINRLVARKLQPAGDAKALCYASTAKALCYAGSNLKVLCWYAGANAKK